MRCSNHFTLTMKGTIKMTKTTEMIDTNEVRTEPINQEGDKMMNEKNEGGSNTRQQVNGTVDTNTVLHQEGSALCGQEQGNEESVKHGESASFSIDEEFKNNLPPLSEEEYEKLEAGILKDGCRNPLVICVIPEGKILGDGHNRYEICMKHNLPFQTIEKEFSSRQEALDWMLEDQGSRRNMGKFMWAESILKRNKSKIAALARENQLSGGCLKSDKGVNTLETLAKSAGISRDTMYKVEFILARAAEDPANEELQQQIDALRKGTDGVSINKVHKALLGRLCKEKPKKTKTNVAVPTVPFTEQDFSKEKWMNMQRWLNRVLSLFDKAVEDGYKRNAEREQIYRAMHKWASEKIIELTGT